MTTLPDRPNTALVVIDVQNGVVDDAYQRDAVVANIGTLVDKARDEGVPIVWVQHSDEQLEKGSDAWEYVPELVREESESLVHKTFGDSFEDTDLEEVLARAGVGRLVVAGAQTDACIRSTIHGAFVRGYDVTLVGDAHTTEDQSAWGAPPPDKVIAHTNLYWQYQTAPGRTAAGHGHQGRDVRRPGRRVDDLGRNTGQGPDQLRKAHRREPRRHALGVMRSPPARHRGRTPARGEHRGAGWRDRGNGRRPHARRAAGCARRRPRPPRSDRRGPASEPNRRTRSGPTDGPMPRTPP